MKANTAFIYALRIWFCTLIVGSILAVLSTFFLGNQLQIQGMLIGILVAWVYLGVYTLPLFLGLFLAFWAIPTRENNSFAQKILYSILLILMLILAAYFLLPSKWDFADMIAILFYIFPALATMLYFYPKGINIDTIPKHNPHILDDDL